METMNDLPALAVTSPAFSDQNVIPDDYTCKGKGISPELHIRSIPKTARTLALIMEDPDAPGKTFDHWVVFNIAPLDRIPADSTPGLTGKNSKGENKYHPPCPPSGSHHYIFKIFALDALVYLDENSSKHDLLAAMETHVVGYGELTGIVKK